MSYRGDINFLRALAVLLVVLYHFNIPLFSAGYIGVDIFFVISGYLMTGIIISSGSAFSYLDFLLARVRRILPALVFLCLALLVYGWIVLPPNDYSMLAKHSFSSLLFYSNYVYFSESGYFDVASHSKWLLHTWSLSVEWQFYIVYPILLVFIKKAFPRLSLVTLLLGVLVSSLALSLVLSYQNQSAAFYMLPTRAWEMVLGGLVYLKPARCNIHVKTLSVIGLLVFTASVGVLSSWPGYGALIPAMLAYLFLSAPYKNYSGGKFFELIGKVSYSFYLWHWPFSVVFHDSEFYLKVLSILCAFIVSCFSYYFIETPFRRKKILLPLILFAFLVGVLASFYVEHEKGYYSRFDSNINLIDEERSNKNNRSQSCNVYPGTYESPPYCIYGGNGKDISLILVGDSHSNAVVTAVAEAFSVERGGVLFLGADGCRPLINWRSDYFKKCGEFNFSIMQILKDKYPEIPVLVVSRTTSVLFGEPSSYINETSSSSNSFVVEFLKEYKDALCVLSEKRPVYVLGQIPEMKGSVPDLMIDNILNGVNDAVEVSVVDYYKRHLYLNNMLMSAQKDCGVINLDPLPYMCSDGYCSGETNGKPLYYDHTHLTEFGNRKLVPLFKKAFTREAL